jgi:hypothetical protein
MQSTGTKAKQNCLAYAQEPGRRWQRCGLAWACLPDARPFQEVQLSTSYSQDHPQHSFYDAGVKDKVGVLLQDMTCESDRRFRFALD